MANEGRKPPLPLWVAPSGPDGEAMTWADLFGGGGIVDQGAAGNDPWLVDTGLTIPAEFPLPAAQVATLTPPAMPATFPLPAGQVTALTPPAALTGFATEGKQDDLNSDIDFRYGGGKTAYVQTIASSGNHDALTPPAGGRIQVFWCTAIPNSDNAAANLVDLGFGVPGGPITTPLYRSYALSHWEVFEGAVDEAFIITTATSEPVAVTVHYKVI